MNYIRYIQENQIDHATVEGEEFSVSVASSTAVHVHLK